MTLGVPQPLLAGVIFLVGVVLVVGSVETFVGAVTESALALGVSAFFLTVLLAGTDLENAILGLAAVVDDLPSLALGTVFGEALFVLGVGVGLAGVLVPFETTVPRTYLALAFVSPALLLALAADGTLSRLDGVVLTLAFVPLLVAVYLLERGTDTRYLSAEQLEEALEDDEDELFETFEIDDDRGWVQVAVAVLAVVGMTVGSELAVTGARDLLVVFGLSGLAFGATVMSFIASIEELFLTVEPVRQGRPHLGVGNVVGSVLFFVTANAGVLALVAPIDTGGAVVTLHWPFFLVALVLVLGILVRGRVGRPEGAVLLSVYVAYWGANLLV
jgi:cation:H+ antiporter